MMKDLLLGLIVFLTHLVEAVTGFGATVLGLPFATAIIGLSDAVRLLVVIAFLVCGIIALQERRHIDWRQLLKIALFMAVGMPLGMWAFRALDERLLKRLLGAFMVITSLRGLIAKPKAASHKPFFVAMRHLALFAGGVIHGAFGCGGPLLVLYSASALPDKRRFRATMCLTWTALNAILIAGYLTSGGVTAALGYRLLVCLPFLAASIWLGNVIHNRLPGAHFLKIVYAVLLLSGIFMMM